MEEKIRQDLLQMADEKYRQFHSSLCPGTQNMIGIRVPILKAYGKEIVKGDWRKYLKNARDDYYEETLLQGIVIGTAKMPIEEVLQRLETFIPKIHNWAVCDITCAGLKVVKKNLSIVWDFLQPYLKSEQEFEVRFAVVILLDFYIIDEYIDRVLQVLDEVKQQDYYAKMAIAWSISICYIKQKEKTLEYLKENHLDNFTYNKALQKTIESTRISKEEKEILKKMKR